MFTHITRLLAALATTAALAAPAQSKPVEWGAFKDNGCINPVSHPGLRAKSAVLWNIPAGQSWETTCARTPATIDGVAMPHPVACVNTAITDPLAVGLTATATGTVCGLMYVVPLRLGVDVKALMEGCRVVHDLGLRNLEQVSDGYYAAPAQAVAAKAQVKPWPFRTFGAVLPPERAGWKGKLAAAVARNGVGQVKQNGGGLNIWGVFAVPDETCLPPDYLTRPNAPWSAAAKACDDRGMRLCRAAEVCAGGRPVLGQPEGDVWAAVSDHQNAWISIGTAYPDRLCREHAVAVGVPASWGQRRGPQPITGKPTAFRCCP